MNAVTHALRRPGRRMAELDPFVVAAQVEPAAGYGCVDWYVYGEDKPAADARTQQTRPRTGKAGLPLVVPFEPQARTQRH